MVTIKELAAKADVSPTTVSIVLSGKGDERKISQATQKKVFDTAKELGYQPNVSARRLRVQSENTIVIALFWASDFRAPMMVRFLRGLQEASLKCDKRCEFVIHTYKNDYLSESLLALGMCHVAIVGNASEADMKYLERHSLPVPVVLYNRHSEKYCTVNVNDSEIGGIPVRIFASRKHKSAVILTSDSVFPGMDVRLESFIQTAEKADMTVEIIHQDNSMKGGYEGGKIISAMKKKPDCLFCMSDYLAVGAMRAFYEAEIQIPDALEIISVGNGDRELEEYAFTPLSVVVLPMEKMAMSCFKLALDLLERRVEAPCTIELPVFYRQRGSCGGENESLTSS